MNTDTITVLGVFTALATFFWGVYLVVKKDREVNKIKMQTQMDENARANTATNQVVEMMQLEIANVKDDVSKLESAVEKMGDKLEGKLDKIMDILMEQRG